MPKTQADAAVSQLIFPFDDSTQSSDSSTLQKMAFESMREKIYQRVQNILEEMEKNESDGSSKETQLSAAFLQAICFAKKA